MNPSKINIAITKAKRTEKKTVENGIYARL